MDETRSLSVLKVQMKTEECHNASENSEYFLVVFLDPILNWLLSQPVLQINKDFFLWYHYNSNFGEVQLLFVYFESYHYKFLFFLTVSFYTSLMLLNPFADSLD